MKEDKWIHDIQAGELINLKDCHSVYISEERDETDNNVAKYSLAFLCAKKYLYLFYESNEHLHNAFEHYKKLLNCEELDVSVKPLTL